MRKIKFRGFSVQQDRFVYSDLITQGGHIWITEENGSDLIADESTVGEFTGAFKLSRPDGIQFTIEKEDVLEIVGNIHSKQTAKQPEWCTYPDAAAPVLGCWSLLNDRVTGEDFCKGCELYKENTAQDEK